MGKSLRRTSTLRMATALQQAVAMYFLLVAHAKGETDLTEDQLEAVVSGVCDEAHEALVVARRAGLLAPVPDPGPSRRAYRTPVRPAYVVHSTVQ